MNIGKALKLVRSAKRMTLDELMEKSGLSKGNISDIERGKQVPSICSIKTLADALQIPLPLIIFLACEESEIEEIDNDLQEEISLAVFKILKEG